MLSPPSEATAVAGVDVAAAYWNTQIRDAVNFLANPPHCVCWQSAAQSLANGAWTSLLFGNNRVDSYSGHSTTTNTSRYVAQVQGWHEVEGIGDISLTTSNPSARLAVNGTAVLGSANAGSVASGAGLSTAATSLEVFLNVGDYVEIQIYQSSGAAVNTFVSTTDFTSSFEVRWSHV